MRLWFCLLALSIQSVFAYVPTVESLFRHGVNPEVTTNALLLAAKVTQVNPYAEKQDQVQGQPLWVKWVYNVTPQGKLKLTQLLYRSAAMNEASLVDKTYVGELTPQLFTDSAEKGERGLFLGMLNSMLINDGSFMVDFLRARGVNVRLNEDLINQDKRSLLQRYRAWLIRTKGGRVAGADESPLAPANPADKEKVDRIMAQPMYEDTRHVTLTRHQGEPAWHVKTEVFEGWVGDGQREIRELLLRSGSSETDIQCRDYILFNGTHSLPRQIMVKGQQDHFWQIDIMTLKPFNETSAELVTRLKKYDQILMQKREAVERPAFLF